MSLLDERNRPKLIAILILAAVFLHFSIVQYTTKTVRTYEGYVEISSIEGEVIFPMSYQVADMACFADDRRPCLRAVSHEFGIFPHRGVPYLAAILGGILLPLFLFIGAAIAATRIRAH